MRLPLAIATFVLGSLSTPAIAQAAEDEEIERGDEVLCRSREPRVGTRIGARRVCRTRQEWEQLERESQTEARRLQQRGSREAPTQRGGAQGPR